MPSDPATELVDAALLVKTAGPAPRAVLGLLESFAASFATDLSKAEQQAAAASYAEAADQFHRLKGAAGSLGLCALAIGLAELEHASAHEDRRLAEQIPQLIPLAERSIDRACAVVRALI
ncbi:MAG: hypothetical protein HKO57_04295 [Akkermansiaceae bacterium]|nr:hypothetical protein [Akkermansiaceae bacterium]